MIDFFTFWVSGLWGSAILALVGTAFIFAIIGVLGRMSYMLLGVLLALYFVVFGVNLYGVIVYLPLVLLSVIYFGFQIYKFFVRE